MKRGRSSIGLMTEEERTASSGIGSGVSACVRVMNRILISYGHMPVRAVR